jgi:hypothetical protein
MNQRMLFLALHDNQEAAPVRDAIGMKPTTTSRWNATGVPAAHA